MNDASTYQTPIRSFGRWAPPVFVVLLALLAFTPLRAQLSGTYTIDPAGGSYTSIASAITDLEGQGVSGPVTFEIAGGTYTAPTSGYDLESIASMNATNTVTFRPASGATVVLNHSSTSTSVSTFNIDGGDYYVLDGSNGSSGASFTVRNTGSGGAVRLEGGAQFNVIMNMTLIGTSTSSTGAILRIGTAGGGQGNSYNLISSNTIGDRQGVDRSAYGIYMTGSSSDRNTGNVIENNDVINFGNGTGTGYGIYISSYNQGFRIIGNTVGLPVPAASGTKYGIYHTNSYNTEDTIAYNTVYNLNTDNGSNTQYGIRLSSKSSSKLYVHNNFVSLNADRGSLYAIYFSDSDPIEIVHNTVYLSGEYTSGSTTSYGFYNTSSGEVTFKNNVIVNVRTSTGSNSNRGIYISSSSADVTSNYNLIYVSGQSTVFGYDGTDDIDSYFSNLQAWRQGTGKDANSLSAPVTFISPTTGDLHIDPRVPFVGEGQAQPLGYQIDIDGQMRDLNNPDIGADAGDHNGGGVRVLYPNGGEQVLLDFDLTVRFDLSRPLPVIVEYSTDAGAAWTTAGTLDGDRGTNTFTFRTPAVKTDQMLVRVISRVNNYEGDTSDATFELVQPTITVLAPNGGEEWVATDTNQVRWTSELVHPTMRLRAEFSVDGGQTWLPLADDLTSRNLPETNTFDWTVPNLPTEQALVRLMVKSRGEGDTSDAFFTIIEQPNVDLLTPLAGEEFFSGDTVHVTWTSLNTFNIRLEYTTNGGATWTEILHRYPAYLESFDWVVPASPTDQAALRIINDERTRFNDIAGPFSIIGPELVVVTPNGGESYDMGEPVTVEWSSAELTTLRLEYSSDNGNSWLTIDASVDAETGSYTFTPPSIPTRSALVRLSDVARPSIRDASDRPFEILPEPSIVIFTPAPGDRYVRNTQATISFEALGIENVDIFYSSNDGISWVPVAANVPTAAGTYRWNVPNALTDLGRIRIRQSGGSIETRSGLFSIVEPGNPSINVVQPNGGEAYDVGETISIRWSSTDVSLVSIHYSDDDGTTWKLIQGNVAAINGVFGWTAPNAPGDGYRIRVQASPTLFDDSDGSFEIVPPLEPSLTVIYPNGGESFDVGSQAQIEWSATDIAANLIVSYSIDAGTTWTEIATVPASDGAYAWTVPAQPTAAALVRVADENSPAEDVSDEVFSIIEPVVPEIVVDAPNGGEVWKRDSTVTITWTSNAVDQVKIELSTDGGSTYVTLADPISAAAGSFNWQVTGLGVSVLEERLLVRISDASNPATFDVSDAPFTYDPVIIESVTGGQTIDAGLSLEGVFPNPFARRAELRWTQSTSGDAQVHLYDNSGRLARTIELGRIAAGEHVVAIDGEGLETGAYIYELRVNGSTVSGRIVVLR